MTLARAEGLREAHRRSVGIGVKSTGLIMTDADDHAPGICAPNRRDARRSLARPRQSGSRARARRWRSSAFGEEQFRAGRRGTGRAYALRLSSRRSARLRRFRQRWHSASARSYCPCRPFAASLRTHLITATATTQPSRCGPPRSRPSTWGAVDCDEGGPLLMERLKGKVAVDIATAGVCSRCPALHWKG